MIFATSLFFCKSLFLIIAPIPKDRETPAYYYPTQVGDKWEYRLRKGEIVTSIVSTITKEDGIVVVGVDVSIDGKESKNKKIKISPEGVYELSYGKLVHSTPECLLRLPVKFGSHSTVDTLGPGMAEMTLETKVGNLENVKVKAGTFQAVRIDSTMSFKNIPNSSFTISEWYSPRIGLIKQVSASDAEELFSFKPKSR